jgi:hypothetical protein
MKTAMTKTILFVIGLTCTLIAQSPPDQRMETVSGKTFVAMQAAATEATRNGLDVSKYKILAREAGSSYVVTFDDPERPPTQLGSTARMPTFEVEVSRENLHIVRSHFVR